MKAGKLKSNAKCKQKVESKKSRPTAESVDERGIPASKKLTKIERAELEDLESSIGTGLASFREVGRALSQINASRLYREEDDTFEKYCARRWHLSRQHAYRLIKADECYQRLEKDLPKGATLPFNESQIRPLLEISPKKWADAWKQVISEGSGASLTAELVEKVVGKLVGRSGHPKETPVCKKRPKVPKESVAKMARDIGAFLRQKDLTIKQLRDYLAGVQKDLTRFYTGLAS